MILVVIFISPITKYLIEKYDVQLTGREIRMDWAYVDPFTGYCHLNNLRFYECQSDSIFFRTDGFNLDLAISKLFGGVYEISKLHLTKPWAVVIQDGEKFNFSDLLVQFGQNKTEDSTMKKTDPVKFNLLNLEIEEGEFHFREKTIPIVYFIKNVNIKSSGIQYDSPLTNATYELQPGIGSGWIGGAIQLNLRTLAYSQNLRVKKFSLNILEQYLHQISAYGKLQAILDVAIESSGNFNDPLSIDAKGKLMVSDFHFGKSSDNDYAAFKRFSVRINQLCPSKKVYHYDSVLLDKPYFKFERYDSLDNIQNVFGKGGERIQSVKKDETQFNLILEIANYVKTIGSKLLESHFRVNRISIGDGCFIYNDYTQQEKFSLALQPFQLNAFGIDKDDKRAIFRFSSGLKPFGNAVINLQVNPKDIDDFELSYQIRNVPVAHFNPFLVANTSFPINRGTLELNGTWSVRDKKIASRNRLILLDPLVGKRVKKRDTKWVPVPLVMALVRERGNVIDYEIPITGNLSDPKFNVWDPVVDVIGNIFIKPPTIPYGIHVRNVENKLEKSLSIKWEANSAELGKDSYKFLGSVVEFLDDNKNAKIEIIPRMFEEREKEVLLLYEAKRRFYLGYKRIGLQKFTSADSLAVVNLSSKDPLFMQWLDQQVSDSLLFTVQHKSLNLVGEKRVQDLYKQLVKSRKANFLSVFPKEFHNRLIFKDVDEREPFNGISLFELSYEGEFPEKLRKGYINYRNLNDDLPREYFKEKRKFRDIFF